MNEAVLSQAAATLIAKLQSYSMPRVRRIMSGTMTHKYEVDAGSERFVVRFYPQQRGTVVDYEPDVLGRCRAAGLGVPEVIADSRTGPMAPLPYMIYRMLPGISLNERLNVLSDAALDAISDELLHAIRAMSKLEMTGWGDLRDAWHGSFSNWSDFLQKSFEEGLGMARKQCLLPASELRALDIIRSYADALKTPARSTLAWADVSAEHVILDDQNHVVGLIDFESALAADDILNIGYFAARYGGTRFGIRMLKKWSHQMNAMEKWYISFYAVLRGLRILRYSDAPLPTGQAREPITEFLPGLADAIARTASGFTSQEGTL